MPARKKARIEQPDPDRAQDQDSQHAAVAIPLPTSPPGDTEKSLKQGAGVIDQNVEDGQRSPQPTTSWYGGTWPRNPKSNAVTQVAKETISIFGNTASDVASDGGATTQANSPRPPSLSSPLRSPASYLSRRAASSTRSLPLAAAPTKLNITSSSNDTQTGTAADGLRKQSNTTSRPQPENAEIKDQTVAKSAQENDASAPEPPETLYSQRPAEEARPGDQSISWLKWFSKADNEETKESSRPQSIAPQNQVASPPSPNQRRNSEPNPLSASIKQGEPPRSWLGIWGSAAKETTKTSTDVNEVSTLGADPPDKQTADKRATDAPNTSQPVGNTTEATKPHGYGWAFWSTDDSRDSGGKKRRSSNVGELALAGSPSQSKPENASIDESQGIPDRVSKRPRPLSMQEGEDMSKTTDTKVVPKKEGEGLSVIGTTKNTKSAATKAKKEAKNLVIPSFRNTYRTASRPGLVQQLSRLFRLGSFSEPKHLEISSPRKVTRALAIGVHGYFPAPLIRSVLGQPTGTSIRFANSAASAVQKWCQGKGYSCEIEKVALEGEGKIAERRDLLWKLLLNWIDKIRKADFVMIACHSQGVPVALMLVAKLIAFGCVNSARIGVCAMAGVNMGPFADYKSRWIGGSAAELFDFGLPDSQVSKDYESALDVALKFGVRIVYIGSIDDQLVSLEVTISRSIVQSQPADNPCSPRPLERSPIPMSTAPSSSTAASMPPTSSPTSSVSLSSCAISAYPTTTLSESLAPPLLEVSTAGKVTPVSMMTKMCIISPSNTLSRRRRSATYRCRFREQQQDRTDRIRTSYRLL